MNGFDSEAPEGLPLTSIGNDFCQQARIASQRLVQLLGGKGEVAILQGGAHSAEPCDPGALPSRGVRQTPGDPGGGHTH